MTSSLTPGMCMRASTCIRVFLKNKRKTKERYEDLSNDPLTGPRPAKAPRTASRSSPRTQRRGQQAPLEAKKQKMTPVPKAPKGSGARWSPTTSSTVRRSPLTMESCLSPVKTFHASKAISGRVSIHHDSLLRAATSLLTPVFYVCRRWSTWRRWRRKRRIREGLLPHLPHIASPGTRDPSCNSLNWRFQCRARRRYGRLVTCLASRVSVDGCALRAFFFPECWRTSVSLHVSSHLLVAQGEREALNGYSCAQCDEW
jgi:hypothetical protein